MISDFPYYKKLLIKERIRSLWKQILSLRDATEETHCLIQKSPFEFSVLAMPLTITITNKIDCALHISLPNLVSFAGLWLFKNFGTPKIEYATPIWSLYSKT